MRTESPGRDILDSNPPVDGAVDPAPSRPGAIAVAAPQQAGWRRLVAPSGGLMESSAWLNTMVHDIRQPLAALRISGASLEGGLDELEMQDELRALRAGLEYLTELVDELADGHALCTGDLVARPARFDVGALVAEVVTAFQPRARMLDKRFAASVPGGQTELRSDRALVKRVVCNLVDNALRYGRLRGRVVVRLAPVDEGVELIVEDDGPGIAQSVELTEHGALRARGGLGVGLLFSARAVEALGGVLEVSTSGPSRVRVSLPNG